MDGIETVETGLRPGEKLYEELLVKSDILEKTDNALIFVEKGATDLGRGIGRDAQGVPEMKSGK